MSEDCEVCQRHREAFDAEEDEGQRRMLVMVWRFHDRMDGHRVHRYLDEAEGLITVRL